MAVCYFLFKTHIVLVILFTCSLFSQFSFLPPIPFLLFNPFSQLQSLFSSSIPFLLFSNPFSPLQSLFSSSNSFFPPPIPFLLLQSLFSSNPFSPSQSLSILPSLLHLLFPSLLPFLTSMFLSIFPLWCPFLHVSQSLSLLS